MRNYIRYILFFLAVFTFLLNSCDNTLEVNAPKKDLTIVYGLMDPSDSLHFIKINKAYLVEGDAEEYARKNYDETIYEDLSAFVIEKDDVGQEVNRYQLRDTLVPKESGTFDNDGQQVVYYFKENALNEDHIYQLRIRVNQGKENEKLVEGETEMIKANDFNIESPAYYSQSQKEQLSFYNNSTGKYSNEEIEWISPENAKLFDISLSLNYMNVYNNGDSTIKRIEWNVGSIKSRSLSGGEILKKNVNGRSFFQRLVNEIPSDLPDLNYRRFKGVDIEFSMGDDDLNTYITLNGPSNSIVQERPEFSNLDTAAYGIYSSRFITKYENFPISARTEDVLTGTIVPSDPVDGILDLDFK